MPLSGQQKAAFDELNRRGSLTPDQVSAYEELSRRETKSPMQLQHEHNLNVGVGAQDARLKSPSWFPEALQFDEPLGVASEMIAAPVRALGLFGGSPGAMAGETVAQTIEQAGGAREGYDPVAIGAQAAIPAAVSLGVKGVAKAVPVISDKLRQSAQRQYSKVLGPTTKENKLITERVVPQLLEKKVRAGSRAGLMAKAGGKAEQAGEDLEVAYAALPQDAKVQFVPVLQQIQKAKDKLIVQGTDEIVDQDLYKALNKVQDKVLKIAGGAEDVAPRIPEASVATTRSARQAFDTSISKKTKIFGKTGKETAKLEAQKEAANAIRAELAQEYPDVARINKEFNLWKNVEDVLGETMTRTASQATPSGERLMTATGVVGGLATGGIGKAVAYATGLKLLSKAVNSTAWRTVSAVEKNRLANLLASGKTAEAEISLTNILSKAGKTPNAPTIGEAASTGADVPLAQTLRYQGYPHAATIDANVERTTQYPLSRSSPGGMEAYHGTGNVFEQFGPGEGIGPHFGTKQQANAFATEAAEQGLPGHVRKVHLDFKNPLKVDFDSGWENPALLAINLQKKGILKPGEGDRIGAAIFDKQITDQQAFEQIKQNLAAQGYDSIAYPNKFEGEGLSYISLKPGEQIR